MLDRLPNLAKVYSKSDDPWEGSPFKWIRMLENTPKGDVGAELICGWLSQNGYVVDTGEPRGPYDLCVSGEEASITVEMKTATGLPGKKLRFDQFRRQDWDFAILLALWPDDVHIWIIPYSVIYDNVSGQHGGKKAKETSWLTNLNPSRPPQWIDQYGGHPDQALAYLRGQLEPFHDPRLGGTRAH